MSTNLSETVISFIKNCSELIGKYEAEKFVVNKNLICQQTEHFTSPIEHILFTALSTVRCIDNHDPGDFIGAPQWKIGKYRVDIFIVYKGLEQPRGIIIECDSQEFHERSEKERRYEKRRDRCLQSYGHDVFHYTGKEILEDPFKIAREIFAHLKDNTGNNSTHETI